METRIQRHKNYRAELIKEGIEVSMKEKPMTTTTALPIKEVIDMVDEDSKTAQIVKKQRRLKILKFTLLVLLLVGCVVGLIFFGIYAWR